MKSWTLGDGEALNREHPRSFFVPSRERRDRLRVGELVKLLFEQSDGRGERMWVEITEVSLPHFVGELANEPSIVDLRHEDRIEFEARHVIAIEEDPERLGYSPGEPAAASRRLIERDQPPDVVAWQPAEGCFYLFAGDESESEVRSAETFMRQDLGLLVDRFPALEEIFRSPRAPGFWRRGPDGSYIAPDRGDVAG